MTGMHTGTRSVNLFSSYQQERECEEVHTFFALVRKLVDYIFENTFYHETHTEINTLPVCFRLRFKLILFPNRIFRALTSQRPPTRPHINIDEAGISIFYLRGTRWQWNPETIPVAKAHRACCDESRKLLSR